MDILVNHKNFTSKNWCRNTGFTYKNWIKHCTRMTRLQNQAIPMNQTFSEPNSTVLWIQRILIKMDAWRSQTTLCPRMTSQVAQTVCLGERNNYWLTSRFPGFQMGFRETGIWNDVFMEFRGRDEWFYHYKHASYHET